MLNQRRLALPPKLADRLLAGLVPSAATAPEVKAQNILPDRAISAVKPATGELANGDWLAALKASEPSGSMQVYGRSEEHTSELQSLMRISYAVFCLKKKKHKKRTHNKKTH